MYSVWLERYSTGRERRDPVAAHIKTLTEARKIAYKVLTHKGINRYGNYKVNIYSGPGNASDVCIGEVVNTLGEIRYWYPETGGKYKVMANGTIGKKLRW